MCPHWSIAQNMTHFWFAPPASLIYKATLAESWESASFIDKPYIVKLSPTKRFTSIPSNFSVRPWLLDILCAKPCYSNPKFLYKPTLQTHSPLPR